MTPVVLNGCILLGAAGYQLPPSTHCTLIVAESEITVQTPERTCFLIPLLELHELQISGPGVSTTGGGFVGGGFGVEGALEGMAIAGILNALTTKTKIHTFISLTTNVGEMHFHYGSMEPSALRIALGELFRGLRRLDPQWRAQRLAVLQSALERKNIDQERFHELSARLGDDGPLLPSPVPVPSYSGGLESCAHVRAKEPKAQCPSCDCILPATTHACPHCGASLGPGAAWSVVSISQRESPAAAVEVLSRCGYEVDEVSGGWRVQQEGLIMAYAMSSDDLAALAQLAKRRKPLAVWFADLLSEEDRAGLLPVSLRKARL